MDIGPPKEGVAVGAATASTASASPGARRGVRMRRLRALAAALLLAAGLGLAGHWLLRIYTHAYVDDARIAADMIAIASRVPGWVREVTVVAGDQAAAGAVVIRIDSRESELAVAELEARLASLAARRRELDARIVQVDAASRSQEAAQRAKLLASHAALAAAEAERTFAETEFRRALELAASGSGTRQRQDQTRALLDAGRQKALAAQAEIGTAEAMLAAATAAREEVNVLRRQRESLDPQEAELRAQRDRARLDLRDRTIVMPFDGVIDRVFVDAGEYVSPGQRIMLLHDPAAVRVEANVKETELRFFRPGTPVHVRVDAWPGRSFDGVVDRVAGAATSEFSLLPTPNPSGNFTKITQRVPIRIRLDPAPEPGLMRPGMMVVVEAEARE
jgi:membrane fusion protein (multidrug efflux system)